MTLISCHGEREGCTDPDAINYDVLADVEDNSCSFPTITLGFSAIMNDSSQIFIGSEYTIDTMTFWINDLFLSGSQLEITTDKDSLLIGNIQMGLDSIQEIEDVKVANIQAVKFSVNEILIEGAIDITGDGNYEALTLTCNDYDVDISPIEQKTIDRLGYELDIRLRIEQLLTDTDLFTSTTSCDALPSAFDVD